MSSSLGVLAILAVLKFLKPREDFASEWMKSICEDPVDRVVYALREMALKMASEKGQQSALMWTTLVGGPLKMHGFLV